MITVAGRRNTVLQAIQGGWEEECRGCLSQHREEGIAKESRNVLSGLYVRINVKVCACYVCQDTLRKELRNNVETS